MKPGLMVIAKIGTQCPTQGVFIEDDDMVETLPTDGTDHALDADEIFWRHTLFCNMVSARVLILIIC